MIGESISRFASYVEAVGKVYAIDGECFWVATRPLKDGLALDGY